jgi:lysophospholipase L1-like esterase
MAIGAGFLGIMGVLALFAAPACAAEREVVVFLGDSLTFGGGTFFKPPEGVAVYNLGVPSDTTMGVWARLSEALAKKPTRIFLQVGINDLGQGIKGEDVAKTHLKIWREIRENLPEARLYVISLLPVREASFVRLPPGLRNAYIRGVNRRLAKAAEGEGLTFIDLFSPLQDPEGQLQAGLTFDGVHLTAKAYKIWRAVISPYLPE